MSIKKILLLAAIIYASSASAQIKMPAASSSQTIVQDFGMGKLELSYSRPNIKGRELFKENSELAPLGKVWRTGANAATKLTVIDPISIGGHALDTGSYAIFTILGKTEWTIIINKGVNKPATQYDEKDDVFRITVPANKMKETVETFTIQFANIKAESCDLQLVWGNVLVNIPITTNIRDRIRTQVETAVAAEDATANTYFAAANFYYDLDKDLNKALATVSKATEANPKAFLMFILKAKIERDLGDKASAKADAEKCASLAAEQNNDDYVRMANELIQKL
jgi:hypothetical protein